MSEMDARTDTGDQVVASTLKRLADRLPACTQELRASEVCVGRGRQCMHVYRNGSYRYRVPYCMVVRHPASTTTLEEDANHATLTVLASVT